MNTKLFKLALLATLTYSINIAYSQTPGFQNNNILLPEKLIMAEHVWFDTIYNYPINSSRIDSTSKPLFDIQISANYLKLLSEKAMNGTINVNNANDYSEFYPYSVLEQSRTLEVNEILKNLGQDTFKVIDSYNPEVEQTIVKAITLDDITSVNFIEDWVFSLNPLRFTKNVYAIEPVRCTINEMEDDPGNYRYRKAFRFYNLQNVNSDKSTLKLIAKVQYENFFNLNGAYFNNNYKQLVEMCFAQSDKNFENNWSTNSMNEPFFNPFNQKIFIQTLLNQVFEGKAKATNYNTSQVLTPSEARGKVFEEVTVMVTNLNTWQDEARTVENDYTSEIKSVIFIEEWYYNETTMQLTKKVTGIAPVRYFYTSSNDSDILRRQILFTVQLN
ncbi:MAG: hypothetical protein AB7S48_00830 [Bacteroidales bacterium]